MLFRERFLEGIRRGEITLAFRRWARPSVRPGGTLRTPVGVVRIGEMRTQLPSAITEADARAAGFATAAELRADLQSRPEGEVYRIEVGYQGVDPRISLRQQVELTGEAWEQLEGKLRRLDAASAGGPWTTAVLRLLADSPGVRAGDLARRFGQDQPRFKRNVRKLKELGLAESLEVGYRLSPRGQRLLERLEQPGG